MARRQVLRAGGALVWAVPLVQAASASPAAAGTMPPTTTTIPAPGTGTPGYWKNHPSAWPVQQLTVGGVTYTRDQCIAIMKASPGGDYSAVMFSHLVSTKLNVIIGNDSSCVAEAITKGDRFLARFPLGRGIEAGEADAWTTYGEAAKNRLDDYNNGRLPCARHRD